MDMTFKIRQTDMARQCLKQPTVMLFVVTNLYQQSHKIKHLLTRVFIKKLLSQSPLRRKQIGLYLIKN